MEINTREQKPLKTIREGEAEICLTSDKVFYNPVQEFNRDLSIAVLSSFIDDYKADKTNRLKTKFKAKDTNDNTDQIIDLENPQVEFEILEALSATGLRSIRYAKEIKGITKIIANDLSKEAVKTIKENIVHNKVQDLVSTSHEDACMLMYQHKMPSKRFAAIDLDPYGCPSIFLDSAVQSVQDGGLLLITATDMAVLAGNSPETCYCKYGAALRILLQCIEQHANRYSRYIEPLLSISADFYVRVFVKVHTGAIHCKKTTSKLSMVYHCVGCGHLTLQPLGGFKPNPTEKNPNQSKAFLPIAPPVKEMCEHCNQRHHLGGPIWSAPIHNESFVTKVLMHVEDNPELFKTSKRLEGILSMVREELHDVPLYYTMDRLFGRVHLETMPMLIMRSAIMNGGYKVSYSHAAKNSVKTNAPGHFIWDIVRTWEKTHPIKPNKSIVDLTERPDANPISRRDGRLRFQFNPLPFWGPGTKASTRVGEEKMSKSTLNQNKYTKKEEKHNKRDHSPPSEDESRKKTINVSDAEA
ncbi:Probable tRNA [Eumeta japonica]|uniref:tRNA (guanine(26)-N(2))-dimethyltransferase n=1 Tax=Eumeta variegata TaxID=151549 RepID=A0A4C1UTI1_EUMVA|nr:Probable tRNA [Eumeta japonica]